MATFDERMAQLTLERRAKIEAKTDVIHREHVVLRELRTRLNLIQGEMDR